ncbi:cystatin-A1-like [Kryptolebias marmoratus]|uniref:Cystatin-B n=1 Tax=Kryptolebias marmoratus TaxID=37003 RepID=A0A3Q3A9Q0_KRYMA|nr:cystatin-A1-like [Kryptolebias marmoratus]
MDVQLGGCSDVAPATDDIQKICDTVKSQVEGKTNRTYEEFKAVTFRKQTVYGYHYFIKVHVGGSDYLHLFVYESPDRTFQLKGAVQRKDEDPLLSNSE